MIAVGLSWKMAIGACVLGNTIMGLVITVNGRMGAIVSCTRLSGAKSLSVAAPHAFSGSFTHAVWVLLQLLRCSVSMRSCYCLAWVSLNQRYLLVCDD